jgi:hypothetical protein
MATSFRGGGSRCTRRDISISIQLLYSKFLKAMAAGMEFQIRKPSRRSVFVLFCFSLWPLCCLSFFDLRILIAPLVSDLFIERLDIVLSDFAPISAQGLISSGTSGVEI